MVNQLTADRYRRYTINEQTLCSKPRRTDDDSQWGTMTETTPKPLSASTDDCYVVQYDRLDTNPISVAIAEAVATYRGTDATELEPLHYAVNADALERLFEPRADGLRTGGSVTFEYSGCLITVAADGEIRVTTA